MIAKIDRNKDRQKRHKRVRAKISGTTQRPRISLYRSVSNIYAQLIDDVKGVTICSASTVEKDLKGSFEGKNKKEQAKLVGAALAKKALEKGVVEAVFDRSGYLYTGRVQNLAEGAREAGLKF